MEPVLADVWVRQRWAEGQTNSHLILGCPADFLGSRGLTGLVSEMEIIKGA